MFDLIKLGNVMSQFPMLDIRIKDLQIDIEPSDILLLPSIHIDAKLDIRFSW